MNDASPWTFLVSCACCGCDEAFMALEDAERFQARHDLRCDEDALLAEMWAQPLVGLAAAQAPVPA